MNNLQKTRRNFLKNSSRAGLSLLSPTLFSLRYSDADERYKGLKSGKYLSKIRVETWIKEDKVFTEGPAVDRLGHVYFTNIPTNRILRWDTVNRETSIIEAQSNAANGLRFGRDGKLLACVGGTGKIIQIDLKDGSKTVLAENYGDKKLQSPNDLEIDSKGRIYFTSRSGDTDLNSHNKKSVYRLDKNGEVVQLLTEPEIHMPNGIVLSPDEKILYLIEAHSGANRHRKILAFDLSKDGSISNKRTLIDFYPGRSGDGMCIDEKGNLYVAAGLHQTRNTSETLDTKPGIHVISPEGKLVAYRETPVDTVTNCTFGGKDLRTLYITCGSYLLKSRTKIPGKKNYRPLH